MSLSPFFYVEKWNASKECYEKVSVYRKAGQFANEKEKACGFEEVDFWPWNGTHDIFSLLGTTSRENCYDRVAGVHRGVPPMVSKEIKAEIERIFEEDDPHNPPDANVRWITLADLYVAVAKNPKVVDYNADWEDGEEKPLIDNPLNIVIKRIESYIDYADDFYDIEENRSLIRLVYWVLW